MSVPLSYHSPNGTLRWTGSPQSLRRVSGILLVATLVAINVSFAMGPKFYVYRESGVTRRDVWVQLYRGRLELADHRVMYDRPVQTRTRTSLLWVTHGSGLEPWRGWRRSSWLGGLVLFTDHTPGVGVLLPPPPAGAPPASRPLREHWYALNLWFIAGASGAGWIGFWVSGRRGRAEGDRAN